MKRKGPKAAGTVAAARQCLVCARVLIERALHILGDMEDSQRVVEVVQEADKKVNGVCKRLEVEINYLKHKERKQAKGEWRQDMEATGD